MSKTDIMAIGNIGRFVEQAAGRAAAAAVMEGSASLAPSSGKAAVSGWVRCAMDRLDASTDVRTRTAAMRACGQACAERHAQGAEGMRKRYAASADLDAFLAEETRRFGGGVRYERRGSAIIHVYEPLSYKHPTRCYCGLAKGLKPGEMLSATFCECSAGYVEYTWERILGKPVTVKLIESAVSGGSVCRFEVRPRGARTAAGKPRAPRSATPRDPGRTPTRKSRGSR
jgi:hypothetical protein